MSGELINFISNDYGEKPVIIFQKDCVLLGIRGVKLTSTKTHYVCQESQT